MKHARDVGTLGLIQIPTGGPAVLVRRRSCWHIARTFARLDYAQDPRFVLPEDTCSLSLLPGRGSCTKDAIKLISA
jgi:hypothetical protein